MNKTIIKALVCGIALIPFSNIKSENISKNVLLLTGVNQDTINAVPILDGVVIKFENDSVILKKSEWRTTINKEQLEEINHVKSFHSDLSVRVLTNENLSIPLAGKFVTLHNEYDEIIYGIINKTTQEGETLFKEVPAGFYTLYVSDPENVFELYSLNHFHHGLSSSKELLVKEKVTSPEDINFELIYHGDGLYDVLINWETSQYMTDYSYLIYLNDELIEETTSDCYVIPTLAPGEYDVMIVGRSAYGNIASEGRHLHVVIDDNSGVQSSESESLIPVYFDLQGRIIRNPVPGIYIYKGKKVIIK